MSGDPAVRYQFEPPGGATWFGFSHRNAKTAATVAVPAAVASSQGAYLVAVFWLAAASVTVVLVRSHGAARVVHRLVAGRVEAVRWRRDRAHSATGAVAVPAVVGRVQVRALEVDWPGRGRCAVGVVVDDRFGQVTVSMRVEGSGFELLADRDQDQAIAGWGGALAPLARQASAVKQVMWQEWARPVGVDAHREFLAGRPRPVGVHRDDYEALLDERAPWTVAHETLVSVTVAYRAIRRRRTGRTRGSYRVAAAEHAARQLALLAQRLTAIGLHVTGPLSADEVGFAIRARLNPSRLSELSRLSRSLASAAGHRDVEWGPMSMLSTPRMVQIDGSWHRAWRAALLPMLPVPADWLSGLLSGAPEVTRTVSVVFRPVPAARAVREVSRALTELTADQNEKARQGFRLRAREVAKVEKMEARERELAAGFAELEVALVVTATASTPEQLDDAGEQLQDAGALLDLRPLDFGHAAGAVAATPIGRIGR